MAEITEFTWRIDNFHMYSGCPGVGDTALRSPEIPAGNPHHSNWYLELITSDLEGMTYYTLNRTSGSISGKCTCEISVVCPEINNHKYDEIKHFAIECHDCCLNMGTLTLRCRLTFLNGTPRQIAGVEELSKNIGSLYESKNLSDITVRTNDKDFFLHKFLLSERAPKLFEELKLDDEFKDGRVKFVTIPTPVLEILVQYIYSGKLGFIAEEYLEKFYQIIEKYKLENVSGKNLPMDLISSICTRINVEQKIISWGIDAKKPLTDKYPLFKDCTQFDCASFLIRAWFERYPLKCIKISIQCVSILKECVGLRYRLSVGKDETSLIVHPSKKLRFVNVDKPGKKIRSAFSVPIPQNLKNKLCVKLELEVSAGDYSTYSVTSTPQTSRVHPSVFGMGLLRHDISNLYHKAQKKTGDHDVSLFFECDENTHENVLFAHKPILAAWSPVFFSMFDHDMLEKERDEVNIPDIRFATGKKLLLFMYSGEITRSTCAEDMELYIAADKYQISSLFEQCSAFLVGHLTADSACDILVLADQHSDEDLLLEVQQFIGSNRSVIMGSSEWLNLIDINPRLISQVLRYVSGDLQ